MGSRTFQALSALILGVLLLAAGCSGDRRPAGTTRQVLAHAVFFRGVFYSEDRAQRLAIDADHVIDDARVPTSSPAVPVEEFPALVRNMQVETAWLAQAGIDGLLIDMYPRPGMAEASGDAELSGEAVLAASRFGLPMPFGGRYRRSTSQYLVFAAWLEAARASGLRQRFAPQVDLALYKPGEPVLPIAQQIARLLRDWKDHPNFLRRDGRPVVATWAGSVLDPGRWAEVSAAVERLAGERPFWLHEFRPYHMYAAVGGSDPATWTGLDPAWMGVCDGLYQWEVSSSAHDAALAQDGLNALARSHGKLATWSISSGFWHAPLAWGKGRGTRNDARVRPESLVAWHERWLDGLRHGADWAVINTWNDESENHQIFPTRLKGDAYLQLTAYYARWWREGRQPVSAPPTLIVLYPAAVGNPPEPSHDIDAGEPERAELWATLDAPGTLVVENTGERIALVPGLQVLTLGRCRPGAFPLRWEPATGPARTIAGGPVGYQTGQPHQNWFRRAIVMHP